MEADTEYRESTSLTFEWTLKGLKALFDSTTGDTKSKVTKSTKFGGGRWQVLFYPNAGIHKEESGFVSLYLSCEPTMEEKEAALAESGKWVREGAFTFSFELRSLNKIHLYTSKEAHKHSFSHKTANWGWAHFARREQVFYQSVTAKAEDAFLIVCSISSSPTRPASCPSSPRQSVPRSLLDTVGELLDNPVHSDVEFVIPRRGHGKGIAETRSIYASRLMLSRAEYFQDMFGPNFAEGSSESYTSIPENQDRMIDSSDAGYIISNLDDSDFEDDDAGDSADESEQDTMDQQQPLITLDHSLSTVGQNVADDDDIADSRNVRQKLSHPSSPRSTSDSELTHVVPDLQPLSTAPGSPAPMASSIRPNRMRVVVKDVAYATWYSTLYYLYTDTITFAPLTSSFTARTASVPKVPASPVVSPPPGTEAQGQASVNKRTSQQELPPTRSEWISEWKSKYPGRPAPCSAKSAYRLADRLGLLDLKTRAAQHLVKSLTVDNIAYEVFSPFAATFDDIRKMQVDFFLAHWREIRSSDAMANVWQQIRNGRYPGFEEVWPFIAQHLEFKPANAAT